MKVIIDNSVSDQIVAKYGGDIQKVILIEEMSELTKELSKKMRGKANRAHIIEEMAHVLISLSATARDLNINEADIEKELSKKFKSMGLVYTKECLWYQETSEYGGCIYIKEEKK